MHAVPRNALPPYLPTGGSPSMSVTLSECCFLREATLPTLGRLALCGSLSTNVPSPFPSQPSLSIDLYFVCSMCFSIDGKFHEGRDLACFIDHV